MGKPVIARSNRSNQIFFVNKRYVKDKVLSSATEQAFKGLITIGKFGFVILNLEMSPEKVDVNVHPAKLEVRFEEENKVFKAVYHAIKDTLLKTDIVSNPDKVPEKIERQLESIEKQEEIPETVEKETKIRKTNLFSGLFGDRSHVKTEDEEIEHHKNMLQEIFKDRNHKKAMKKAEEENKEISSSSVNVSTQVTEAQNEVVEKALEKIKELQNSMNINSEEQTNSGDNEEKNEEIKKEDQPVIEQKQEEKVENIEKKSNESFEEMYEKLFGKAPITEKEKNQSNEFETIDVNTVENVSVFENKEEYKPVQYKFIGIVFKTYIIIEIDDEMYILDQHAAHERIMYEKIKANYYSEGIKDSQLMLLPDIITLTHKEMDIARENMDMFKKVGFMLEEFGDNTIKLTGVPNVCIDLNTRELFLETLDEINTVARTAKQEKEEKFIATVACKAAVKANMSLTKEEVDELMNKLLKLPNPFTCPHGRPTAIKMSKADIEKKFSRR